MRLKGDLGFVVDILDGSDCFDGFDNLEACCFRLFAYLVSRCDSLLDVELGCLNRIGQYSQLPDCRDFERSKRPKPLYKEKGSCTKRKIKQ